MLQQIVDTVLETLVEQYNRAVLEEQRATKEKKDASEQLMEYLERRNLTKVESSSSIVSLIHQVKHFISREIAEQILPTKTLEAITKETLVSFVRVMPKRA